MMSVLIVIHLLVVVALVAVVLLQRSEGGALGTGGGGGFMTGRGQANALTRATAVLGFLFFALALGMSWYASWNRAPSSVFEQNAPTKSAPAAPAEPNLLDQLKGGGEPAAPATPSK